MWRQRYNTINPKNEVLRIVLLIKYPPHGKKGCECGPKSERHRAQREHRETCLGLSCSPVCLCFPPRCSSCSWLITPASSTGEAACSAALAGTWAGNTCRLESRRVCSRFLRAQTTCGYSGVLESNSAHSHGETSGTKWDGTLPERERFLLCSQFPPELSLPISLSWQF